MLYDHSDKKASKLFKERLNLIREILDTYPENQENAEYKKYAMDTLELLESLEWIIDKNF